MDEQSSGFISGAASGAATGATIAGPWGAVIGGVVGGVFGLFSGGAARKARLKQQQANNISLAMNEQDAAIQRRDLIRQSRVAQATALAQGTADGSEVTSSGVSGTVDSLKSQTKAGIDFLNLQSSEAVQKFKLTGDAQSAFANSQAIGGLYQGLLKAAPALGSNQNWSPFGNGLSQADNLSIGSSANVDAFNIATRLAPSAGG